MLSDEAIKEFMNLYKKEYREELTKEKARDMGERLIWLVKAVYKPIPKEYLEKIQEKRDKKR